MSEHIPILVDAVTETLRAADPAVRRLIDGTVGGGGHTSALLDAGVDEALACDLDGEAIKRSRARLADYGERVQLYHGSYVEMGAAARAAGWDSVDAVLLDLGLSSLQMDDPRRGFSFRFDAPLDMRFDSSGGVSARELVNGLEAGELADVFFQYGEERHSRRIARAIVAVRPLETTRQLADLVADSIPAKAKRGMKVHPATRVFQALRIAVNRELESVERVIPVALDLLVPGGRLAVISFHSLEDRIVKRRFRDLSTTVIAPPGMASIGEKRAQVRLVNRKPIVPDGAEIRENPRSRSAKLRVVEKLE